MFLEELSTGLQQHFSHLLDAMNEDQEEDEDQENIYMGDEES